MPVIFEKFTNSYFIQKLELLLVHPGQSLVRKSSDRADGTPKTRPVNEGENTGKYRSTKHH